jgi:hypothetical protein
MMGAQDNELTLEGLAQKLETQAHRLEALEQENADLRSKVTTPEGSGTPREDEESAPAHDGRVSRRRLLSKAGVAAAGLVVAGALTQTDIRQAKAAQLIGDSDAEFRGGVEGSNSNRSGYGVMGRAPNAWGVDGQGGKAGVRGHSTAGYGVEGSAAISAKVGVFGECITTGGTGVLGKSLNTDGTGVKGESDTGVWGSSSRSGWSGVYGQHTGTAGYGLVGDGKGASGAGVLGRNPSGYGGRFEGGKAQLRLAPKGTTGPSTGSHTKGEIYLHGQRGDAVHMRGLQHLNCRSQLEEGHHHRRLRAMRS